MDAYTPELRYQKRLKQSKPVLDDFLVWLKREKACVAPKTKLGETITYCLNQWQKLVVFLKDGRKRQMLEGFIFPYPQRNENNYGSNGAMPTRQVDEPNVKALVSSQRKRQIGSFQS